MLATEIGSGLLFASGAKFLKLYQCLRDFKFAILLSKLNMCFVLNITLLIISLKTKCLTNFYSFEFGRLGIDNTD